MYVRSSCFVADRVVAWLGCTGLLKRAEHVLSIDFSRFTALAARCKINSFYFDEASFLHQID